MYVQTKTVTNPVYSNSVYRPRGEGESNRPP